MCIDLSQQGKCFVLDMMYLKHLYVKWHDEFTLFLHSDLTNTEQTVQVQHRYNNMYTVYMCYMMFFILPNQPNITQ